jgi:hypothetical protein
LGGWNGFNKISKAHLEIYGNIIFPLNFFLRFENNKKLYKEEHLSYAVIRIYNKYLLLYKKYIRNEENDIFVILDSNNVQVINHIYSYNVLLSDKSWEFLTSYFNNEVERRRIEFEREITSNIQHSLKNILTKL